MRGFGAFLPALLCAAMWGSAFPTIKTVYGIWDRAGLEVGLTALWLFAGLRFMTAGVILTTLSRHPWSELRRTSPRDFLIFSGSQTVMLYLLFYWGISLASASLSGLLIATGSLWWMLLAPVLAGTPWPTRGQWMAIVAGGLGIAIAIGSPQSAGEQPLVGSLILIVANAFGAIGMIWFGRVRRTMGARAATGCSLFFGGVFLAAIGSPAAALLPVMMTPEVIGCTLWLAVVSATAFSLWNHLSTLYPVPLLAGYRFLIPLCGMFESIVFLSDESLTWGLAVGSTLVVGSIVAAQRLSPTRRVPEVVEPA